MNTKPPFQSDSFLSFCRCKIGISSGLLFASILAVAAQPVPINPENPVAPLFQLPTPVNVVYIFSPATNYIVFLGYTNFEGAFCTANLIQGSDGKLYGVAPGGGEFGGGTVFSLNTDGTDIAVLHAFTGVSYISNPSEGLFLFSNDDGNEPTGLMLGLDGKLYGTASLGGTNGFGTIFRLNCDGNCFTNLHSFTASDGENPRGGLVQGPGGTLYGTAQNGGTNGSGTVFSLQPDGSGFTVLYNFTALNSNTNTDGTQPYGRLILSSDGTLYGTARYGGPGGSIRPVGPSAVGSGTIFSLNTNGTGFAVLHVFDMFSDNLLNPTNNDGASPYSAMILGNDGKLYGTAPEAGPGSAGTIFCLCTNGSNYTVLHAFTSQLSGFFPTPGYGLYPYGGLIQGNDGILYGAAYGGGLEGTYYAGTLYRLNPDGSGLAVLHTFAGLDPLNNTNADGANSFTTLLKASNGKFYGLTSAGGTNGSGTVFSFAPPVVLQITASDGCVILNWPASATNFVLETSDTLSGIPVWTPVSNNISTAGNSFTFTLSANSDAAFFRLRQP